MEKLEREKSVKVRKEKIEKRNVVRDKIRELEKNRKEKLSVKEGCREKIGRKKDPVQEKTRKLSVRGEMVIEKIETVNNKTKIEKIECEKMGTSILNFTRSELENIKVGQNEKLGISTYRSNLSAEKVCKQKIVGGNLSIRESKVTGVGVCSPQSHLPSQQKH